MDARQQLCEKEYGYIPCGFCGIALERIEQDMRRTHQTETCRVLCEEHLEGLGSIQDMKVDRIDRIDRLVLLAAAYLRGPERISGAVVGREAGRIAHNALEEIEKHG